MSSEMIATAQSETATPGDRDVAASKSAVLHTFNKFFAEFVLFLKHLDPEIKAKLKPHYKIIDNLSTTTEHLNRFSENVTPELIHKEYEDDAFLNVSPAKGLTIRDVAQSHGDAKDAKDAKDDGRLWSTLSYVYILSIIRHIYREYAETEKETDSAQTAQSVIGLLRNVLQVVARIQQDGNNNDEDEVEILDDDLVLLLDKLRDCELNAKMARVDSMSGQSGQSGGMKGPKADADAEENTDTDTEHQGFESMLRTSKIGQLAKELGEEIDPNLIDPSKMSNPLDLLNFNNLSDKNSFLGNVVSKIGTKVQTKIESGEIKPNDLFEEAKGMFDMLNIDKGLQNNPMISNLMKQMFKNDGGGGDMSDIIGAFTKATGGGGGGGGSGSGSGSGSRNKTHVNPERARNALARERIRNKLAEREKAQKTQTGSGDTVIVPPR